MKIGWMLLMASVAAGGQAGKAERHWPDCIDGTADTRCVCPLDSGGCAWIGDHWHFLRRDATATTGYKEAFAIESQTGRVVKLSDEEYARLQKLRRQAVVDAETEIAKGHGVVMEPLPIKDSRCLGTDLVVVSGSNGEYMCHRRDRFQFRGQFLLINLPAASLKQEPR